MELKDWLAIAMVAGFLFTGGGIIAAYEGAKNQVANAETRIAESKALAAFEKQSEPMPGESPEDKNARSRTLYEERDLIRPESGNLQYLSAYEAHRLLGVLLAGARTNLLVAGYGLVISTIAGVWSLYV
jgi:hypothetical protein